ncbi:MAG: choice-of-anchor D domain-containing protein [Actinomycetota bacterium]
MRRKIVIGIALLALVVATGLPGSAMPIGGGGRRAGEIDPTLATVTNLILDQSAREAGLEHEDQTIRRQIYLQDHRDPSGRVRPDLWRQGIEQLHRLRTVSTWRNRDHVSARQLRGRLASAAATPGPNPVVVGVRWKQIGPAPLRVDPTNTNAIGDTVWFQGSGPASGEVTDIAIDPRGSVDRTVYIATNDGGIWKTTNGGISWTTNFDDTTSLSMGAVAIDPINRDIVYAGTGNGFDGGCLFTKGVGLYKSIDAGSTWALTGGNTFNNLYVNRIRVLPGNVVLVAASTGLFRSVDGGVKFGNNAPSFDNGQAILQGNVTDLDIDTASPSTVYASAGTTDYCTGNTVPGTSGVFVSTDGGATFPTNLFSNTGAPTATSSYIGFAQGTNVSKTMYATVSAGAWDGLYRSTNSGTNWTRMAAADAPAAASTTNGCQCGYDQTIGVDPLDVNRVYIGFQEVWLSTDGGQNFPAAANGASTYKQTHWDQHALVFSPSTHVSSTATTTPVWIGHDGGVSRSKDGGTTWENLNESIATNLLKEIDMGRGSDANRAFTYGGAQDTGTSQRRSDYAGKDWHLAIDGDGLSLAVDPGNPSHAITTDNGLPFVTTDGGNNWVSLTVPASGSPSQRTMGLVRWDRANNANVWAVNSPGNRRGFLPGFQLMRSTDTAATFSLIGAAFGQRITAIAVDPNNSNNVWLGFIDGTVRRSSNALALLPAFAAPATQPGPGAKVSEIAIDPNDATGNTVIATYEGVSNPGAGLRTQHVYRTTDGGANWADISGTDGGSQNLPDLPTHSVVIDPGTSPSTIIVGNDGGVLRSIDSGATWQVLGTGLPTVDSESLAIDTSATPPVLRVGTYGRSVFELVSATGPVIDTKGDLAFGQVQIKKSDSRVVQVFNVGTTDLHISSFTKTAGSSEFSIVSGPTIPATITPGTHLDWLVKYAPVDVGADTATFTIASDDPNNGSLDVPASGEGVESLGGGDGGEDCAKRYVAQGDGVVVGTDIGNDGGATQKDRYSDKLLNDKLKNITGKTTGSVWCLYNTATDPATTDTFVQGSQSQQSQAWNMKPDLITLQLGRQNSTIVDHVDKCYKNIKKHEFVDANVCALLILANQQAWDKLKKDLSGILNSYKTAMSGNPTLVVSVLGYYNPYPSATSVATKIPGFCADLVDTVPTCIARWVFLPPALVTLDQIVKKLNDTIKGVVQNFITSSQGRFFFINPYDKFKDHCMQMKVQIKTTVYHPPSDVDKHDTDETNFGCDQNWVVKDGDDVTDPIIPFQYLTPAVDGVLLTAIQTTKEMGINPNKKGHQCIEEMIWETVKNKLGVPEKQDINNACSSI